MQMFRFIVQCVVIVVSRKLAVQKSSQDGWPLVNVEAASELLCF